MSSENKIKTAIILVDHGSRRAEAHESLLAVAELVRKAAPHCLVEIAHMELAAPDIAAAVARCLQAGVEEIVIHPYLLAPGRHALEDIPAQARAALGENSEVRWRVTEPIGVHPLMANVVLDRCGLKASASLAPG